MPTKDEFRNWHQDGPPQMLVPNYSQMEMRIIAQMENGDFIQETLAQLRDKRFEPPPPPALTHRFFTSLIALRFCGVLEEQRPLVGKVSRQHGMRANFALIYGGRPPYDS